ncbi:MAG: nicotinate (nicotinamide) nucleotide adenylyltransferase [Candidatus Zixiibacteriota bacterium]|nr:MAG: nicotinate (nicotinamide) nucleotide adenylyltransferase [candidate division Zixibacteria bacterium]
MPGPEKGENWGILGGAFDPVHRGHITLADDICKKKKLKGVLFVPSFAHPFKQGQAVAPYRDRVAMLELVTEDREYFLVEEIESREGLSGYTVDTIRALKTRYPGATFCFIIGADNIQQISAWHQPESILAEMSIVAGTRPGYTPAHARGSVAREIEFVQTLAVDISSSEIRQAIKTGRRTDRLNEWLDDRVKGYIDEHGLYR